MSDAIVDHEQPESADDRVKRGFLKLILIGLLVCAAIPVAGFAVFALIMTGFRPEVFYAVAIVAAIFLAVILAILFTKKAGMRIGVGALIILILIFI